MSQGCCESRDIIYDQVQTQCCQFFILIKKDVFFLQRVVCVLLPRGRAYLQLEKTTIGKSKN